MYEISKYEFYKWVDSLNEKELSEYDITMLNIILDNYDLIASGGTAGGVRVKNLGKLIAAQKNILQTSLHNGGVVQNQNRVISKVKELHVEHFRGFGIKQEFKFDKQYTFFHGANGSGKTSFCEALEYSLLGSIEEASARNIPVEKYIVHAGEKKAIKPSLKCLYNDGTVDECEADLAMYRFSFIEKNRIDEFSHIGAASAKSQTERIAALFGLSEFQEFVKGFSADIDKKYIKLESDKEENYKKEKERLEEVKRYLEQAKKISAVPKAELGQVVSSLNNPEIVDAKGALAYLGDGRSGLISKLTKEMNEHRILLADKEIFIKLQQDCIAFINAYKEVESKNNEILSDVKSLNLKVLYDAITRLDEKEYEEYCPVCLTPMSQVKINPFIHAREEICKFTRIESAKESIKKNAKLMVEKYEQIKILANKREVKDVLTEIDFGGFQNFLLQANDVENLGEETKNITNKINTLLDILNNESDVENRLKVHNEKAAKNNKTYEDKLNLAQNISRKLVELQAKLETAELNEKKWREDLEAGLPKLEIMQAEITQEKVEIEYNKNMVNVYRELVKKLNGYISTLPLKMATNLSDKAKEYYNYINEGDADFELINELRLPVASNEKIMISMKDGAEQDALQILSEGHVKILGLSILLAKAKAENSTFLIFDDIVNSIDDDHRDGVAQLLITNKDFEEMQMILTCHGEIFVSSLESYVVDKKAMTRYMFLPADTLNERGVVIKYEDATIPLKVARQRYEEGYSKEALAKCRQAVECISFKLFKKIAPSLSGISIKMRNLSSKPDLYNVMGALKTATKEKDIEGISEIHTDLERLMDEKMWVMLNKGTHIDNDIPEFSRPKVKVMLELLEKLAEEVDSLKVIGKVKEQAK